MTLLVVNDRVHVFYPTSFDRSPILFSMGEMEGST